MGDSAANWVDKNKQWLIPLASGAAGALSTPSAGGAGPIIGAGIGNTAQTYAAMQAAQAKMAAAQAKQKEIEEYHRRMAETAESRAGSYRRRVGVLEDEQPLKEKKVESEITRNIATARKAGRDPVDKPVKEPAEEARASRAYTALQKEYQADMTSRLLAYPPQPKLSMKEWVENDPAGQASYQRQLQMHNLTPEKLGFKIASAQGAAPAHTTAGGSPADNQAEILKQLLDQF